MRRALVIVCAVLLATATVAMSTRHDKEVWPSERNIHIDVESEELKFHGHRHRRQITNRQPIRISAYFDPTSFSSLPTAKKTLVTQLTNDAISYFESTYSVVRVTGPIRFSRSCTGNLFRPSLSNSTHKACASGCLATTQCGGFVDVPAAHLRACYVCDSRANCATTGTAGPGVANTDLVIYVAAIDSATKCAGTTVAFASSCAQEATLNRPIVGYVNLCPRALDTSVNRYNFLEGTIRHEMYHILAFAPGLFAYYRDSAGNPRTSRTASGDPSLGFITTTAFSDVTFPDKTNFQWSATTLALTTLSGWVAGSTTTSLQTYQIVTPKVKAFVRSHFNCASLEGALLENQGGSGTALTHWEKRVFQSEVMTGTFVQDYTYSALTLSLMEDSGWYGVNYTRAATLRFGRHAGCDFVRQSCGSWMAARNSTVDVRPFCLNLETDPRYFFCNAQHTAKAVCSLKDFTGVIPGIPTIYRYMTPQLLPGLNPALLSAYGGSTLIADYCPTYQPYEDRNTGKRSECFESANQPSPRNDLALEVFDVGSTCVIHGRQWSKSGHGQRETQVNFGSGCYKTTCTAPSTITIQVGSRVIDCTGIPWTEVSMSETIGNFTYAGSIICPEYAETCYANREANTIVRTTPPSTTGTGAPIITTSSHATSPEVMMPSMLLAVLMMSLVLARSV